MKTPTVYTTKAVLELYKQEIAKVLGRQPEDVLAISVFNIRDYELAKLLQFVYNKGINDVLDSDRTEDVGRSQYD
jgi:hypothetical protein